MSKPVESYYFRLPMGGSEIFAAISTLQSFLPIMKKRCDNKIHVVLDVSRRYDFLLRALDTPWVLAEEASTDLDDYDLVFEFDTNKAYKLSLPTEKHIVQAYGTLLGAEPNSMPNLEILQVPAVQQDIGILLLLPLDVNGISELVGDEVTILVADEDEASVEAAYGLVSEARMVVGFRGGLTYMAASLGRSVLEIYDDSVHSKWLTKLENRRYTVMYIEGVPEDITPLDYVLQNYESTIIKAIGDKWTRLNVQ